MPKTYTISQAQAKEINTVRKGINNKKIDKRLYAVQLRGEGFGNSEIAVKLDTSPKVVSRWVSSYLNKGIESLIKNKYLGNRRNMSLAEEEALLAEFKELAERGQIIEIGRIKAAYEAKVGHTIGGSQIYYVLRRHGWRKVIPGSKHPGKASDEEIDASKKLKLGSTI